MDELETNTVQEKSVVGNETIENYIKETARWGKFLAIVGYVVLGILLLLAFAMMFGLSAFSKFGGQKFLPIGMGLIYILLAGLYYIPVTYLYRFSVKAAQAVENNNEEEYLAAFQNLKSLFKFLGIFTIVIFSIYALVLVIALPMALLLK
jgi:hypothetical protein